MKLSRLANPVFATVFVLGGARTWRNPGPAAHVATPLLAKLEALAPGAPDILTRRPELAVRANAAVQVVAGTLLATDRLPRAASLALAASLVPTTFAGHSYWNYQDPKDRANHRIHFLKNTSLVGALLAWATKPSAVRAGSSTPAGEDEPNETASR